MKRCKVRLEDIATLDRFLKAVDRAEKGKRGRRDVNKYNENKLGNTLTICEQVRSGKYEPSPYHDFYVYDPKKRLVQALPFPDRIVHQWLVEEVIKPYFVPRFVKDNYACIPERGTHAAVYVLQKQIRHAEFHYYHGMAKHVPYAIKLDISKFFPNVNRDILFRIIKKRVADPGLQELIRRIIFDPGVKSGIPIGNYTSQYFANIYLNELDHHCKDTLHLKNYVRYMDDFIIVAPDKKTAIEIFAKVKKFVNEELNLPLNPKSKVLPTNHGVDFAGYIVYGRHLELRPRSKRHLRMIVQDFESGKDDWGRFCRRVMSWVGYARHADRNDDYAKHVLDKYLIDTDGNYHEINEVFGA